jgi:multicomponent K+:H+ antiporter subunit E
MTRRLLPHPYLTLALVGIWLALNNEVTLGGIVFGLILGIVIPIVTAPYWPGRPRIDPIRAAGYFFVVLWDIVVANAVVARIVLFMPRDQLRPAWVVVPLELHSPEAITVLAGTITMTPGTVSAEFSTCGRALLVHCLHAPEPDGVVAEIKSRYERRLKEVFE